LLFCFCNSENSCTFAAPTSFKHKRNTQATEDLCPPQPAWLCLRNDVGVILKTSGGHFFTACPPILAVFKLLLNAV